MKRKLPAVPLLLAVLGALAFCTVAPALAEWLLNGTRARGPYRASERGRALHARLLVADMHADTLLWDRDVLARSERGHVDVPRLAEGGVALQLFTVVSKTPYFPKYDANPEGPDGATATAVAGRWPLRAVRSLRERALPFDTTGVVLVTDALLAEGFTEEEVGAIMGGNVFRLLAETLPRSTE